METVKLLIYFTDGSWKTIEDVYDYNCCANEALFWFVKNGYRSFIPVYNVKYFGRACDWVELPNDNHKYQEE